MRWLWNKSQQYPDYSRRKKIDFHKNSIDPAGTKVIRNNLWRLDKYRILYDTELVKKHEHKYFFTHEGIDDVLASAIFKTISFEKDQQMHVYTPRLWSSHDIEHMLGAMPMGDDEEKMYHLASLLHLNLFGYINKDGIYKTNYALYLLEKEKQDMYRYLLLLPETAWEEDAWFLTKESTPLTNVATKKQPFFVINSPSRVHATVRLVLDEMHT